MFFHEFIPNLWIRPWKYKGHDPVFEHQCAYYKQISTIYTEKENISGVDKSSRDFKDATLFNIEIIKKWSTLVFSIFLFRKNMQTIATRKKFEEEKIVSGYRINELFEPRLNQGSHEKYAYFFCYSWGGPFKLIDVFSMRLMFSLI